MRWTLSLTAISGRPTRTVLGRPAEASTSTSTGTPSIPTRANVFSLASMTQGLPQRRDQHRRELYPKSGPFAILFFGEAVASGLAIAGLIAKPPAASEGVRQ